MENEVTKAQYGRVKGASWFPLLYKKDILVLGQGGIGSWVSLLLSRIGCNLHLYDMDTYEEHNMSGQFVTREYISSPKVYAIRQLISEFSPDCELVDAYEEEYTIDSLTNNVTICGFDNMIARRIAFDKWKAQLSIDVDKSTYFFQDGRLLAEQLQIFNIPGDKPNLIERYEKDYLFDDGEVEEAECTFKQTSHCAAMIASHMVGFLTNWIGPIKQVPFFFEYVIPINYMKNDKS